MPFQSRQPLIL